MVSTRSINQNGILDKANSSAKDWEKIINDIWFA